MGRPGQQVVARRDPGELERSWRGVLSRWRLNEMNLFAQFRRFIYPREALGSTDTHELKERCKCILNKIKKIKIVLLLNDGRRILKMRMYSMWHVPQPIVHNSNLYYAWNNSQQEVKCYTT